MLDPNRVRKLLRPFGFEPSPVQADQVLAYLDLLLRWNLKINLTAIRTPDEAVTRHFGESLFIARHLQLAGRLMDIGTGAGFPGLALKIAFPELSVTLLEPVTKKRAFLKEVVRVCAFTQVDVRGDRLETFAESTPPPQFEFATMRAVGNLGVLIPLAAKCLKPAGSLLLWLSDHQTLAMDALSAGLTPAATLPIPLTRTGNVWRATRCP